MDSEKVSDALAQTSRERDFYLKLLELGAEEELEPFLGEALAIVVALTGAQRGYLSVEEETGTPPRPFWIARGCSESDLADIRSSFSSGVIGEALARGETIVAASALDDPRFRDRGSVQRNRIEAVLCAPIGRARPVGVLYLQGRNERGPFSDTDRRWVELFARHVFPFADRLLIRRRDRETSDPTLPFRRALRADGVVGRSSAIARTLKQVSQVAPLDVSVLLTGPSGTGKTQIARVIHDNGPRASGPFVELNCAALPESLLESELFGALPGAHSAATRKIEGKIAAAERGTLFLDEIGELSLTAQAKLLQLLQSKEYHQLGASRPSKADVRVLAATNADLKAAVANRSFREDLFYRLQVVPLRIPALSERRSDIPELCEYFCGRACASHHLPYLQVSRNALIAAEAAEWPGNIRELAHAVEAGAIRAAGDGVLRIEQHHLFPVHDAPESAAAPERETFQAATRRFQEQLVRRTLEDTQWNVSEAASLLDLTRAHVYNLIRIFGFKRANTSTFEPPGPSERPPDERPRPL